MGEIASVDLGRVRDLADRVSTAASEAADLRWPPLHPDELRGSAVSAVMASRPAEDRLAHIVTGLREWVTATRRSADAFEHTDTANGERFTPR
jgi:hypothetical protein